MKSLSSIELHYMVQELKSLEGSRVDNIYQKGKEELLLQVFKSNEGKKLLRIIVGKSLFLTSMKEDMDASQGFCMLLRKHLEGSFLEKIEQVKPERIAKMIFSGKGKKFNLYIELFGKGNVILCDENNIIVDALHHQEFKDRKVEPKSAYKHPQMEHNVFSINREMLERVLTTSTRDSVVKCLAIDLGMGGLFAEGACLKAKLDKNAKPKDVHKNQQHALLNAVQSILSHPLQPIIYLEEGELEEVLPYPLDSMSMHEHKASQTFSEAIDHYTQHASPDTSTSYDSKVAELKRIIEQQEKNIASLEQEEKEHREKAEALYPNYMKLDALLKELKHISEKHSWQEIKEKLKGHALVKDVNPKEKSIVVELGQK
jgi:predicted ribosome quality control (RQC) complex YloA/Tae2 family protein